MGLSELEVRLELQHCLLKYVRSLLGFVALVLELLVVGIEKVLDLLVPQLKVLLKLPHITIFSLELTSHRKVELLELYALLGCESILLLKGLVL